ncbi:MAG: hypothetical protein ABSG33_07655 [Candidatus Bathyarchaeia archaeon]|jgi:hypothetical protein
MTTETELKEIRSLLLELNKKVEGLSGLLEERVIGCAPLPDEAEAYREYEAEKKNKTLEVVPWKKTGKGR